MFADKAIIPNLLVNCLFFVLLGRARLEDMMRRIMDGGGGAEGVGGGSDAEGAGGGGGGSADGEGEASGIGRAKSNWCGTLTNPTIAETKALWNFNQPHGPVPAPPYRLKYIIIGAGHRDIPGGTPHLQIYLELQDGEKVSIHFPVKSLISCVT